MNRQLVLLYLNMCKNRLGPVFTENDAKIMSQHIHIQTGKYIPVQVIMNAAHNSPWEMVNKYLEGLWNSLISKYGIQVIVNPASKVVAYK